MVQGPIQGFSCCTTLEEGGGPLIHRWGNRHKKDKVAKKGVQDWDGNSFPGLGLELWPLRARIASFIPSQAMAMSFYFYI